MRRLAGAPNRRHRGQVESCANDRSRQQNYDHVVASRANRRDRPRWWHLSIVRGPGKHLGSRGRPRRLHGTSKSGSRCGRSGRLLGEPKPQATLAHSAREASKDAPWRQLWLLARGRHIGPSLFVEEGLVLAVVGLYDSPYTVQLSG